MASAITAHVGYSHLFPGARVFVETTVGDVDRLPETFPVEFSDGSGSTARLLREDGGSWVLSVEGYSTAKGTRVDERVWAVAAAAPEPDGIELAIGARLPAG